MIPTHLNIRGYSLELNVASRDNSNDLGRMSESSGGFAVHTEVEDAVPTELTVLLSGQGSSLCASCSQYSFISLGTGR